MTVCTGHAAHPGHIGHGHWGRGGGGQVDDPLAVGPGAGNPESSGCCSCRCSPATLSETKYRTRKKMKYRRSSSF